MKTSINKYNMIFKSSKLSNLSSLSKLSNIETNNKEFIQVQKRFKFKVGTQPGLTRYNWDYQDYNKYPYEKSKLTHGTNAEELIHKIPVIEVDDDTALCTGVGEMHWGHPIQFIALNTRNPKEPNTCKYCGLQYVKKAHH